LGKGVNITLRREGILISAAGVRWVWLRHGLKFPKSYLKPEKKVPETGLI
jgi:hypothetical protein